MSDGQLKKDFVIPMIDLAFFILAFISAFFVELRG